MLIFFAEWLTSFLVQAYLRGQLSFAILCQIIFRNFKSCLSDAERRKNWNLEWSSEWKNSSCVSLVMPWRFPMLRLSPSCFLVHLQRSDEKWKALKAENRYLVTQPRALLSLHNTKPHHTTTRSLSLEINSILWSWRRIKLRSASHDDNIKFMHKTAWQRRGKSLIKPHQVHSAKASNLWMQKPRCTTCKFWWNNDRL